MSGDWLALLDGLSPASRLTLARAAVGLQRLEIRDLGSAEAAEGVGKLIETVAQRGVDFDAINRLFRDVPEFHAPPQVFACVGVITGVLITLAEALEGYRSLSAAALNELLILAVEEAWGIHAVGATKVIEEHLWFDPQYQEPPYKDEWDRLNSLALLLAEGAAQEISKLMEPADATVHVWHRFMDSHGLSREMADAELEELRALQETDPQFGVSWLIDLEDLDSSARAVLVDSCLEVGVTVAEMCGLAAKSATLQALIGTREQTRVPTANLDPETLEWVDERLDELIMRGRVFSESPSAKATHRVAIESLRMVAAYAGREQDWPFVEWDQVRNFDSGNFRHQSQHDEWLRQRSMVLAFRKVRSPEPFRAPMPSLIESFLAGNDVSAPPVSEEPRRGILGWMRRRH